ncbi:small integral membrane protein 34 [Tenrec ecaudatus]|uniref:small integral membrane protein 34 n=1 Tax=Tenrec ecaudatus TaxID=94439 RepID=UPI003F5A5EB9
MVPGSDIMLHVLSMTKWTPQGTPNQTRAVLWQLLGDRMEEKNDTNSTRALKLSDGMSAAWYILTIIGIYGIVFLFRLASNILRKHDKSLEDIYYSNLTTGLKNRGLQASAAACSVLTISNRAALGPNQSSPGPMCANAQSQPGTQGIS